MAPVICMFGSHLTVKRNIKSLCSPGHIFHTISQVVVTSMQMKINVQQVIVIHKSKFQTDWGLWQQFNFKCICVNMIVHHFHNNLIIEASFWVFYFCPVSCFFERTCNVVVLWLSCKNFQAVIKILICVYIYGGLTVLNLHICTQISITSTYVYFIL